MAKGKSVPVEMAKATAEAIMESFIPKDETVDNFTFNFTIPPANHFQATYQKQQDKWTMVDCNPAKEQS